MRTGAFAAADARAGIIRSNAGSASAAPMPRNIVRREIR